MNDDHSPFDPATANAAPIDDDVVSAVLDGEATPAERAMVEGSTEGRARLEELRAVADATATPVAPLTASTIDALVGCALDASMPPVTTALPSRRAHRTRTEPWRRTAAGIAAVAAVVLLVAGIAVLVGRTSRSSVDSAASSAVTAPLAGAAGSGAASAARESGPGGPLAPPDLGSLADTRAVLDRYAVLAGLQPSIDHPFDAGASPGAARSAADQVAASPSPSACAVPPVAVTAGETWRVAATAALPEGAVLVMTNGLASPANRVLVVDATSCAVLAEGAL